MVENEDFAGGIFHEAGDLQPRSRDFPLPRLALFDAHREDSAGRVVAVEVGADEFWELLAAIDEAAGERTSFGMRVLRGRRQDRPGALLAVDVKRLASLDDAPTVVAGARHAINLL